MKVCTASPKGLIVFESVFNPIKFMSTSGEELFLVMRDGGYELEYMGQKWEMKEGKVFTTKESHPAPTEEKNVGMGVSAQTYSHKIPETLEEAIDYYLPKFKGMDDYFTKYWNDEDGFASFCHSQMSGGIAMQIRNELDLWNSENPPAIKNHFIQVHKITEPDSMSAEILKGVHRKYKQNAKVKY